MTVTTLEPGDAGSGLARSDLPAAYRTAAAYSRRAQRSTTRWSAVQLILLSAGAFAGAAEIELSRGIDLGALGAAICLTAALIPAVWLAMRNPQRAWYRARAAAESIKTLAWKYAVRAAPFAADSDADDRFASDIVALRHDLSDVPMPDAEAEPTAAMRRMRAAPLADRRRAYIAYRVDEQSRWYTEKAFRDGRAARWWTAAAIAATSIGIVVGFVQAFGSRTFDGLGAASAVAAAATAWMQLKQYRPLAAAYYLTARELATVRQRLEVVDSEETWAVVAAGAEDAISREHTMWVARREGV